MFTPRRSWFYQVKFLPIFNLCSIINNDIIIHDNFPVPTSSPTTITTTITTITTTTITTTIIIMKMQTPGRKNVPLLTSCQIL